MKITLTDSQSAFLATVLYEARQCYIASLHNVACDEYRARVKAMIDTTNEILGKL